MNCQRAIQRIDLSRRTVLRPACLVNTDDYRVVSFLCHD